MVSIRTKNIKSKFNKDVWWTLYLCLLWWWSLKDISNTKTTCLVHTLYVQMLLWSINVKISVATKNLLLCQKPWEFLHFWHFYVWKSFRISCLSVCSDPFIGKAFHAAPTVFISQSLYAESIEVLLLQRTHKVFMCKSRGELSLSTIQCYFLAYFDPKK